MQTQGNILRGSLAALFVIFLWSTWLVVSRIGAQSELTIFDLAALRYGISSLVTLPFVIYFKPWKNLTVLKIVVLTILLGPLYIFCVFGGFLYAPVAHGGIFLNGSLPVLTLLLGVIFFSERISIKQTFGVILIFLASVLALQDASGSVTQNTWKGDILFFISAIFFSGYLTLSRHWNISMMDVLFCSSILNCLLYVPLWLFFLPKGSFVVFSYDFLLQMVYQGIMPNVVGLLLVAYAAKNIGAAATAAFLAGVPPLSTIFGFIFLNESLGFLGWASLIIITPGILLIAISRKIELAR